MLLLLGSPSTWTYILPHFEQLLPASITVSATLDENLSPQMPFSSSAEVLWPHTEATGVADAMIEALLPMRLSWCSEKKMWQNIYLSRYLADYSTIPPSSISPSSMALSTMRAVPQPSCRSHHALPMILLILREDEVGIFSDVLPHMNLPL